MKVSSVEKSELAIVVVTFSSRARIFLENARPFIPGLRLFFKVELSSCTLIPLFGPGSVHSGSVS